MLASSIVMFFYKIDEKTKKLMRAELAERRAAENGDGSDGRNDGAEGLVFEGAGVSTAAEELDGSDVLGASQAAQEIFQTDILNGNPASEDNAESCDGEESAESGDEEENTLPDSEE